MGGGILSSCPPASQFLSVPNDEYLSSSRGDHHHRLFRQVRGRIDNFVMAGLLAGRATTGIAVLVYLKVWSLLIDIAGFLLLLWQGAYWPAGHWN